LTDGGRKGEEEGAKRRKVIIDKRGQGYKEQQEE